MALTRRIIVDCFVDGEGSAVVRGRTWRWEFHEYLGPTFVNKKGQSIDYPPEGSPVWDAFNDWLWGHYTAKKNTKALAAMRAWYRPKSPPKQSPTHIGDSNG